MVSRTHLIARSLRNPSLENLVKLANSLGITLRELFSTAAGRPDVVEGRAGQGKKIAGR